MSYPINWNTDRIFKDGITGTAIHQRLAEITSAIPTFNAAVNAWQLAADAPAFPTSTHCSINTRIFKMVSVQS